MKNLDQNIKSAFSEYDTKTSFPGKDAMWNRLETTMHKTKVVAAFWRVAAIFLGLLFVSGVFAGLVFKTEQQKTNKILQEQNVRLQQSLDSLLTQPAIVTTETRVVEKIVYRDRLIQQNKTENTEEWSKKYVQLQDSLENLQSKREQQFLIEIEQLEAKLAETKNELAVLQSPGNPTQQKESGPFQLKSERIELGIQKSQVVKNQEIELKVFPKNFIQNSNNLNTTLFKK